MQMSTVVKMSKKTVMSNAAISVGLDIKGNVRKIQTGKQVVNLVQNFGFYESHVGNNMDFNSRASGAYIFRPVKQTPTPIPAKAAAKMYKGPLVQEVHQDAAPFASQIVRLYAGSDTNIEFNFVVGPIPIKDGKGKEIVTTYTTDLKSDSEFVTDSNGRQMLVRRRDSRPTWNLKSTEPVSQNYYPVNSRIGIEDSKKQLYMNVLTDRSQGGTSMKDGQIEVMLHRRILHDDAFGVGEALNEEAYGQGLVIRGRHWVQVTEGKEASAKKHRFWGQQVFMDSRISFNPTELSFKDWQSKYAMERSLLNPNELPANVHLLTLEEWTHGQFLLRVEHIFDVHEHEYYSKPVTFLLRNLFKDFEITSALELTLGANLEQDKLDRFKWNVVQDNGLGNDDEHDDDDDTSEDAFEKTETENDNEEDSTLIVSLKPMQIRSFAVDMVPRKKK